MEQSVDTSRRNRQSHVPPRFQVVGAEVETIAIGLSACENRESCEVCNGLRRRTVTSALMATRTIKFELGHVIITPTAADA